MEKKICPICGNTYTEHPAVSRKDNSTLICPDCGVQEALEPAVKHGVVDQATADAIMKITRSKPRRQSMYDREKARVYATGNKWAIENFHATHD